MVVVWERDRRAPVMPERDEEEDVTREVVVLGVGRPMMPEAASDRSCWSFWLTEIGRCPLRHQRNRLCPSTAQKLLDGMA